MGEWRARAFALLASLALALVLTGPAALGDKDLYAGDVGHFELPRDALVAERLHAHQGLPRWIPGIHGGAPALSSQELALFYPPNDLLLLVAPERAAIWGFALHLVVAALGARALARRLGAGDAAALLAGLVYGFGGAAVSMSVVLVYARTAAWLPWAVLGLVRASQGEHRAVAVATLAFLGTYLGGDPLGCAFAGVLGVATALALPSRDGLAARARRAFAALGVAVALTAVLGAVQLVPATAGLAETERQEGVTFEAATARSLWPPELAGLLVPFLYGAPSAPETAWCELASGEKTPPWAEILYVGPIALGLAAVAFKNRGENRAPKSPRPIRDPLVRAGLVAIGLFLPLALGKWLPAYRVFYELPGASLFRFPAKLFLHASLGLALLAGAGAQAVLEDEPTGRVRKLATGVLGGLAGLVVLARITLVLGAESFAKSIDELGSKETSGLAAVSALQDQLGHVFLFALGGALVLAKNGGSRRRLGVALVALVALDLGLACWPGVGPLARRTSALILGPRAVVRREAQIARLLRERARAERSPARVFPTDRSGREETPADLELAASDGMMRSSFEGLLPNAGLAAGVLSQQGFLSNPPLRPRVLRKQAEALREHGRLSAAGFATLLGARFVLCLESESDDFLATTEATVVGRVPGRVLIELESAPPWAAVYRRARFVSGIQGVLDELSRKDPRREVVLEGTPPEPSLAGSGADALVSEARVSLVDERAAEDLPAEGFELAVETPEPGWLVVREGFARGWRASRAGGVEPVYPADLAFRAVRVPRGSSRITFAYEAPGATLGAAITLLGALAGAAFTAWSWRRMRAR
jgi:hypothetical protein